MDWGYLLLCFGLGSLTLTLIAITSLIGQVVYWMLINSHRPPFWA